MTREEAIEILKTELYYDEKVRATNTDWERKSDEAHLMAISALEQELCEPCRNKAYEYGIGRTTWVHLDNKNGTVALPRSDFEEMLQVISRYEQQPCKDENVAKDLEIKMTEYIKSHDVPSLIEVVIKAIKKAEMESEE